MRSSSVRPAAFAHLEEAHHAEDTDDSEDREEGDIATARADHDRDDQLDVPRQDRNHVDDVCKAWGGENDRCPCS